MFFKKTLSKFIFQQNAVVRKNLKWQTYFLIFIICVVCVLSIIRISYTVGEKNHNFNRKNYEKKIQTLHEKLTNQIQINDDLKNNIIDLQHKNSILDSLNKEMLVNLKTYQDEKINLLERVDFYETLMKNDFKKSGLNVFKFKAYKNKSTNDIIYSMLVTCIKGKSFEFNGFYNFKIEAIDDSGMKNIIYPGNNQKIRLEFKYFSRVEGKISLKKNFKISNISVQLFEDSTDDNPKYSSSFRIGKN